jgi:3-deoxy-manno-octulosonate cytidylyltransferase (CMP-KDO synthetase)
MTFKVVIPARYNSIRLPGKPLLDIAGKPMIQHVYERSLESGAEEVIIATDDTRIAEAVDKFGGTVCMTSPAHQSGTDRLAEVIDQKGELDSKIIVNVQGDEPLMPPALIRQVAENLQTHQDADMATLSVKIETAAELFDPHVAKVVTNKNGYAVYFSRAVIPWDREAFASTTEQLPENAIHHRHIGIYAYRCGFLRQYVQWQPSPIEQMESLEQLRVLWNGHRIHVADAIEVPGHGVDTKKDLELVNKILE